MQEMKDKITVDTTRFTSPQVFRGLNALVLTAKKSYFDLKPIWQNLRQKKDYENADKLRAILEKLEFDLSYWGELDEKHWEFKKRK